MGVKVGPIQIPHMDVCMDHLWSFFSEKLALAVFDELKLDFDRSLNLHMAEGQFLERWKRHAVIHVAETPQTGGSVTNQTKDIDESSTLEKQKKVETEMDLVKTPQAGGGVIGQEKGIAKVSTERTAIETRWKRWGF